MLAFPTLSGPTHGARLRVDRKKLALLLRRMTVDQTVAENRRAQIHGDVGILPGFSCLPLVSILRQHVSVCALSRSGDDEVRASPEWGGNVLMPLVGKRH